MPIKPNNIQTGVRTVRAGTGHEGPRLGKVGRMREGIRPDAAEDGPGRHAKRMQSVIYRWSLILAAATALVILISSVLWLRAQRRAEGRVAQRSIATNAGIAARFAAPDEDEALEIVRQALALRDAPAVARIVRTGSAGADEVVDFMTAAAERDGAVDQLHWLGGLDADGIQVEGVLLGFSGRTPPVQRLAMLVPDDAGVWRLDYESFARVCRPSWVELLEKRADNAVVRVLAMPDTYYNGPFMDEERWANFSLAAPELRGLLADGAETLRGYCRKDSPQARALERIFNDNPRTRRLTLEIRRDDGADDRQFEITRVLAADWVLTNTAYDAKFE